MQIRFKQLLLWCVAGKLPPLSAPFAQSPTTIFSPVSTPAIWIFGLSLFVLTVAAVIFAVVFSLLVNSIVRFRRRTDDDGREPPQVYGSNQLELAWTVIPILIVVTLFMASARVIADIQRASQPSGAIEVVAIGHQFGREFRYPEQYAETKNTHTRPAPIAAPHPTPPRKGEGESASASPEPRPI